MHSIAERVLRTERMPTIFCQGCGNGAIVNLTARAIDEMGIINEIAMIGGVGCSSWMATYFQTDCFKTLHGRTLPVAIGLKITNPEKKIIVFVGDGDGIGIGGNHFIHACRRNIDLTVIMVNNQIYGMTGGQVAPTTPSSSKTITSPYGKIEEPMDACKVAEAAGATFVSRWTTAHPLQLKNTIKAGIEHPGFSFIEVMSPCPTQAGLYLHKSRDPVISFEHLKNASIKQSAMGQMEDQELLGKFHVGKFVEKIKPEFCNGMKSIIDRQIGGGASNE